MGFCYMLQYMDKLALSQATLFNLQEDPVFRPFLLKPLLEIYSDVAYSFHPLELLG